MRQTLADRLNELERRAGISGVSPRLLLAGAAVIVIAVLFAAWRWWPSPTPQGGAASGGIAQSLAAPVQVSAAATGSLSASATAEARIWVHVVGAVRRPGLYGLEADARVNDAVDAAGGFLGDAARASVNLARKCSDGEQICVPTEDEVERGGATAGGPAPTTSGAAAPGKQGPALDLNAATADQLDALPGIGPATALKIVADRQANGPFGSVDDLGRVSGIGPKKLEQLKDLICVR